MKTLKYLFLLAITFGELSAQSTADCIGAQPVCNNPNFNFVATPNNGNINELPGTNSVSNPAMNPASPNMGCLLAGENNPQWLLLNITVGGMLEFSFGAAGSPNPQVGLYDWAMWPYSPTACNDIMNNILPPVRCNWNAIGAGGTGIGTVPPGASPGNFEPALAVVAGQQFVICISNFSGVNTAVTFTSTGTAKIGCEMIQANSASVCPGQVVQITPTLTNIFNANYTVQPGNLISNAASFTLSTLVSQLYTINATGMNSSNLPVSASTTIQLSVIPTQSLWLNPPAPYCSGQQMLFQPPAGYVSYTLSSASGYSASGANDFTLGTAASSLAGTYTLISRDNLGCLFSGTTQLSVVQPQIPQFNGNAQVCQNANLQLLATVPSALSYTWFGPNNFTQQGTNLLIASAQVQHAGVYTVQATSASGGAVCVGTHTITVLVHPVYPISLSPSQTLCLGSALQMTALAANASTYYWNGPNAFVHSGSLALIPNAQLIHAGVYHVTAFFTHQNLNCSSTTTTSVHIDQPPGATLQPSYTFCSGSELKITASDGANHYQWTGPNNFIFPGKALSIPNAQPHHAGSYTLQLQSLFDCRFTTVVKVNIIPALELKIAPSDLMICKFQEVLNTTSVSGGSGHYQFSYQPMYGITHLSGGLAYFSPQSSMQYTVQVTDPACPTSTISKAFWVNVRPLPDAEILSDLKEGCVPLEVKLQSFVYSPSVSVIWDIEPGRKSSQSSFTHLFTRAGLYQPEVTVTDVFGCTAKHKAEFMIRVNPKPEPDFNINPEEISLVNNRASFKAINRNGDIAACEWFIGPDNQKFTGNEAEFEFEQSGLNPVRLILTNSWTCKEELIKYVDVKEDFLVYIPNTFTPNGDGLNDWFGPVATGISENGYLFTIYNRWGELIYRSNKPGEAWDGKVSGEAAMTGVYTYKLLCRPNEKVKMKELIGSVYLMR